MKITFILSNPGMDGGTRVVAVHADRLQRRGHEVALVSAPRRRPTLRHRAMAMLRKGQVRHHRPTRSYLDGNNLDHRRLPQWRPITDDDVPDADVVVATWWETAEWVARLSPAKGAKAHFIQHFETWGGPTERVAAAWRLPLHKIVISHWLLDLARQRFGFAGASHVPNSVDTTIFHASPREKQPRPTVGLLYSRTPFKGCEVSLRTLELARRQLPELRLLAFGNCPEQRHLPLPDGAEFQQSPPQEHIRRLYASCDVWLCGSYAEGFHLPPLEAMACRCPVVSTRVGGPLDIVEDGQNGYLVDMGDSDALADRLLRVLNLPGNEWRKMSDAAYATATRYTWDDAVELFEAAMEKAIALKAQASACPSGTLKGELPTL